MTFGAILVLVQGWWNQCWKNALLSISKNWVLKVDLGTHLRDKHGHLFLWDLELFWPSFKVGQTRVEKIHFSRLSWNWVLIVDWVPIWEMSMDTYFYEIWRNFGPNSRLVKPRLKICTLSNFMELSFESWFRYPFAR